MRKSVQFSVCSVVIALLVGSTCFSQDRESSQPPDGPRRDGGQSGFRPRMFALHEALDKDRDGKLSADEIKAATDTLTSLDQNKDGKLSAEEIGWPPQFGGPGGQGRGGRGGRGGAFFGGLGGGGRGGAVSIDTRIMNRDSNRDGKVAADELPKSMRFVLHRADKNSDGAIDETEAKQFADSHSATGRTERPPQPEAAKK